MMILDKRLNDKGRNWRHVYKALILLDFLLHAGSEETIKYAKENIPYIKTLLQFQYVDPSHSNQDRGVVVRMKAKEIIDLLVNNENGLRSDRMSKDMDAFIHQRFSEYFKDNPSYIISSDASTSNNNNAYSPSLDSDDEELRLAIELSKQEQQRPVRTTCEKSLEERENEDLQRALALSQQEADRRQAYHQNYSNAQNSSLLDLYEGPPVTLDGSMAYQDPPFPPVSYDHNPNAQYQQQYPYPQGQPPDYVQNLNTGYTDSFQDFQQSGQSTLDYSQHSFNVQSNLSNPSQYAPSLPVPQHTPQYGQMEYMTTTHHNDTSFTPSQTQPSFLNNSCQKNDDPFAMLTRDAIRDVKIQPTTSSHATSSSFGNTFGSNMASGGALSSSYYSKDPPYNSSLLSSSNGLASNLEYPFGPEEIKLNSVQAPESTLKPSIPVNSVPTPLVLAPPQAAQPDPNDPLAYLLR